MAARKDQHVRALADIRGALEVNDVRVGGLQYCRIANGICQAGARSRVLFSNLKVLPILAPAGSTSGTRTPCSRHAEPSATVTRPLRASGVEGQELTPVRGKIRAYIVAVVSDAEQDCHRIVRCCPESYFVLKARKAEFCAVVEGRVRCKPGVPDAADLIFAAALQRAAVVRQRELDAHVRAAQSARTPQNYLSRLHLRVRRTPWRTRTARGGRKE